MVSLNPSSDPSLRGQQGAFFFGSDLDDSESTDLLAIQSSPREHVGGVGPLEFRSINTAWVAVLEFVCLGCYFGFLFIPKNIFSKYNSISDLDPPYTVVAPCHGLVWLIFILTTVYKGYQHRISRRNGYLSFYRTTNQIRQTPLFALSLGNVVLLITTLLCAPRRTDEEVCSDVSRIGILRIVVGLELAVVLLTAVPYAWRTCSFNRERLPPDQHENLSSIVHPRPSVQTGPDVNSFGDDDYVDELLERQADVIKYLQGQNKALTMRVIELTADTDAPMDPSQALRIKELEDTVADLRERLQL